MPSFLVEGMHHDDVFLERFAPRTDHRTRQVSDSVREHDLEGAELRLFRDASFTDFCAAMDAHKGEKVLVHCAANYRVTAFMGLYRIIRERLDTSEGLRADAVGLGSR